VVLDTLGKLYAHGYGLNGYSLPSLLPCTHAGVHRGAWRR
jgi:hypothetical protein